ncbi:MAG: hypothetical protein ABSH51_11725 [Solirubrobacteraceae bacterium]
MIRALRDIRISRLALAALAALSLLSTVVIVSGGHGRTPAQLAALAALRQPAVTIRAAAPTPATVTSAAVAGTPTPGSSSSGGSGGSGAGSGSSSGSDSGSASSGSGSSSAAAPATTSTAASADTTSASTTTSTATTPASTTSAPDSGLPKVGHVFEIALSTTSYRAAFGRGSAPSYLRSLEAKGTLLSGFQSLGSGELADDLAMVSGQAPNRDTSKGCPTYSSFPQAVTAKANGVVPGAGCVYPETALTIGDQVSSSGHVWKAYIADMGKETCSHPDSNAATDLALPGTEAGYDVLHNPFIYFHSLLDLGDCASDDQDLSTLGSALSTKSKTAAFSFIAPGACEDATAVAGSAAGASATSTTTSTTTATATTPAAATTTDTTSATTPDTSTTATTPASTGTATTAPSNPCPAGQPVGITAEAAFLRLVVPKILASAAYKQNGVLVIAFTAAGDERTGHAVRTGALVLSRYATKGRTIATTYDPYSLLRSIEDMLDYTPLAHAGTAQSFAQPALH